MAQFAAAGSKRPSTSALDGYSVLVVANPEIPWPIRASTSKRHVCQGLLVQRTSSASEMALSGVHAPGATARSFEPG